MVARLNKRKVPGNLFLYSLNSGTEKTGNGLVTMSRSVRSPFVSIMYSKTAQLLDLVMVAEPVLAVMGFVVSFRWAMHCPRTPRILVAASVSVAVDLAMPWVPTAWVLRDAMGPGMHIIEGGSAFIHFTLIYFVGLISVGVLGVAAWRLLRWPSPSKVSVALPVHP